MAQQKAKQNAASKPSMLSEERIIDSDSESDDQGVRPASSEHRVSKQPVSAKKSVEKKAVTNGKKHKTPEPESSSEDQALSEDDDAEQEDEEASEDFSDDESEASGPERSSPPTKGAPPPKKRVKPTAPAPIAAKAFKPPNGFEKTNHAAVDDASDSTAFLTQDLSQKQVWHITAPASVNIVDIKPFNIQDVRSGKPVFSKNGIDYGFLTGLHKSEKLLLATGENVEYVPAGATISGAYHLREIGRSESKNDKDSDKENSEISFTAISTVPPKKPREQPTGLRMRYHPYGSVGVSKGQSSSNIPPTFRMVPELPESQLDKSEKKRKRNEKNSKQREESQDVDAMDIDVAPSWSVKNPDSAKPAKSASQMVEVAFEAATETPVREKKRKKKKHRLADEAAV